MNPLSPTPPLWPIAAPVSPAAWWSALRSLVGGLALALAMAACGGGQVVRVYEGVEVPGRFISDL
ncbi:MAG: hypothetical protein JRI68_12245, partial [Deltaproteobacteria bacterium]|nr:hypothetical protein [Deltaproteobacteria bacterium]